jgi:hypothetical protein
MPYLAALIPYAVGAGEATVTAGTYVGAAAEVAGIAGTALSYNASMQQEQQSKLNAGAQAQAISQEQARQSAETQQAQLRTAQNQRRFRATQENQLSGNGLISNSGSPLDILADTYTSQQRELHDIVYQNATNQWQLGAQSSADIAQGNSQARAIQTQAGATLLSSTASTGVSPYKAGYQARGVSQKYGG